MKILLPFILVLLVVPADDPTDVDLWKITKVEYKEGEELPDDITELDGVFVRIGGYMHKDTPPGGTDMFLLVTDACGCSGQPKVQHYVVVTLKETVKYHTGMVDLEGTFSVGEEKVDGEVISIYRLEADSIDID